MKLFKAGSWMPWVGVIAYDAPNADGGAAGGGSTGSEGGSSPSEGSTGADGGADAGAGSDRSSAAPADGSADAEELEDLLEQFDPNDARPIDQRLKALVDKNKKLFKRAKKYKPVADRLEGVDLDQTLEQARSFQSIQRLARENPKELARILGLDAQQSDKAGKAGKAAEAQDGDEIPDLVSLDDLPFEAEGSPVNKWLVGVVKQLNALNRENQQLKRGFDTSRQESSAQARTARAVEWKSGMNAAAETIKDAGVRTLFLDLMTHAYHDEERRRARGEKPRSVAFLVNHYAKTLKLSVQSQQRASDAARQTIADKTAALPKQQVTNGAPSGAGKGRMDLAAARKRMETAFG